MRTSKYIGGSKLVSFRLPIESLSTAIVEIKDLLSKYEVHNDKTTQKSVKSTTKQSKTTLSGRDTIKSNDVTYNCGCVKYNGLFRRNADCKELLSKH